MLIGRLAHVAIGAGGKDAIAGDKKAIAGDKEAIAGGKDAIAGGKEAIAGFYRELLGLGEVARKGETVFLSGGTTAGYDLALGPWERGLRHFAFQVAGESDLDEAGERLTAAGCEVSELDPAAEYGMHRGIGFVLPSGHVMHLVVLEGPFVFQPTPSLDSARRLCVAPAPLEHITLNVDDVEQIARFL